MAIVTLAVIILTIVLTFNPIIRTCLSFIFGVPWVYIKTYTLLLNIGFSQRAVSDRLITKRHEIEGRLALRAEKPSRVRKRKGKSSQRSDAIQNWEDLAV